MITLKTTKDLSEFLNGIVQPHVTALQGIIDKLPESMRPDFLKLKKDLDETLSKLPPTDQVPAALDASYALQSFGYAMERMQQFALDATNKLQSMVGKFAETNGSLEAINKKVADGLLITKEAATELCGTARKEALDSVKPTILSMRKQQVELAGLPLPADDVLGLAEADYTPRFDTAKKNLDALVKRGFKAAGKGAGLVKDLAWLGATEFAGKLTSYEDVLGGERPAPDPLLGNGGGAGAKTETKARDRMF